MIKGNKINLQLFSLLFILFISISLVSAVDSDFKDINNNDLLLSNENINYIDDDNSNLINDLDMDIDSQSRNKQVQSDYYGANMVQSDYDGNIVLFDYYEEDIDQSLENHSKKSLNHLYSNELKDNEVIEVEHTGNDLLDIQNAIKKSKAGDTISLGNYAYDIGDGQINLTKRLVLLGDGENTLINGTGGESKGCVISLVSITGATIKGIKFNNPTADLTYTDSDTLYGWGIRLDSSNSINIDNCSFINYNREINVDASNSNIISNCYFTGASTRVTNGDGKERGTRAISFSSTCNNNTIENNTFEGSVLDAINVDAAMGTRIVGNTFINNSYSIFLDHVASENSTISNNKFINCGHFETVFEGETLSFQNLPIINCANSFSNFQIRNNTFYVKSNNTLISVGVTSGIGNVNITDNIVRAFENNNASDIIFARFPAAESKLELFDNIIISNNDINLSTVHGGDSDSDIIYGLFGTDIRYYPDGDIILYAQRKNTYLDILFADNVYANSVVINVSLYGDSEEDLKELNGSNVILKLNNNTYNLTIYDGFASFNVEDSFEIADYMVYARYKGNELYFPAESQRMLSILDYTKTIFVEHTGNDTKDLIDAIDKAYLGDKINLGDYNYSDVNEIHLDKDLIIIADNASIELSNSSSSLFNLGNINNFSIANIVFKVNSNNQSLISIKEGSALNSLELTNIAVVSSKEEDLNSFGSLDYKTISLIHILSDSNGFSIEKFKLNDIDLLEGMKSISFASSNSPSVIIIDNSSNETIVIGILNDAVIDFDSDENSVTIILKTKEGNPIPNTSILVNGDYVITDGEGKVTLNRNGNYTLDVLYTDENNASVSAKYAMKLIYIDENNTIIQPEIIKVSNEAIIDFIPRGDSLTILLKTKEGKGISNATLLVNDVPMLSDDEAQVSVPLIANSTVKVVYVDENNASVSAVMVYNLINNVTEIENNNTVYINVTPNRTSTKIIYKDMITTSVYSGDGRIGEYFVVELKDENNRILANKDIKIGFNGRVYNRTTDENGSAKLQINLANQGVYTFAIGFIGDDDYRGSFEVSKITVKCQSPILTASSKTYKSTTKTKQLSALLKTAKGSFIKGKTVKFTVNGKTYSAKTNDKGVAKVNVSLNKKGTYSFTVKFAGDNTFNSVSKKASLTVI